MRLTRPNSLSLSLFAIPMKRQLVDTARQVDLLRRTNIWEWAHFPVPKLGQTFSFPKSSFSPQNSHYYRKAFSGSLSIYLVGLSVPWAELRTAPFRYKPLALRWSGLFLSFSKTVIAPLGLQTHFRGFPLWLLEATNGQRLHTFHATLCKYRCGIHPT